MTNLIEYLEKEVIGLIISLPGSYYLTIARIGRYTEEYTWTLTPEQALRFNQTEEARLTMAKIIKKQNEIIQELKAEVKNLQPSKEELKARFEVRDSERRENLLKQMIESEIQNQEDLRSDYIFTGGFVTDSDLHQRIMLYIDRNISHFENELKAVCQK